MWGHGQWGLVRNPGNTSTLGTLYLSRLRNTIWNSNGLKEVSLCKAVRKPGKQDRKTVQHNSLEIAESPSSPLQGECYPSFASLRDPWTPRKHTERTGLTYLHSVQTHPPNPTLKKTYSYSFFIWSTDWANNSEFSNLSTPHSLPPPRVRNWSSKSEVRQGINNIVKCLCTTLERISLGTAKTSSAKTAFASKALSLSLSENKGLQSKLEWAWGKPCPFANGPNYVQSFKRGRRFRDSLSSLTVDRLLCYVPRMSLRCATGWDRGSITQSTLAIWKRT